MHRRLYSALLALTLVSALAVASPAAASAQKVRVTGERTFITPSAAALQALAALGVTVTPTGGATASNGSLVFTITGGFVTTGNNGELFHSGGVMFTRGDRSLLYRDFRLVRHHDHAFLTAFVGRHRVVYAEVTHFAVMIVSAHEAIVTGELVASRELAQEFNRLVGRDALKPGVELGTLRSIVRVAGP
jgi:hypothetical protein